MTIIYISIIFSVVWPVAAYFIWKRDITWTELVLNVAVPLAIIAGFYFIGRASEMKDIEVWNGVVTGKERVHGHYTRPYDCNCTTDSDGNETCQTCYEDRYTVTWRGYTTAGNVTFSHLDRGSRSVYREPDPNVYVWCEAGQPASIEHAYVNYVQAVPQSLFNTEGESLYPYWESVIPEYPRVYSFYRFNRVLNDTPVPSATINGIRDLLDDELKTMGAEKQVNIIVVFTMATSQDFRHALEHAWEGGNKNDVIVVIGTGDGRYPDWVDAVTFADNMGNELMRVNLREALMNEFITADLYANTIIQEVRANYTRPEMAQFAYLKTTSSLPYGRRF